MAYTDNKGITFNTFDNNTNRFTKKLSHNQYAGATVNDLAEIESDNGGKLPTIVNAVEIDWNSADLSSAASSFANAADTAPVSTITTTGELMKGVYSPMFAKAA